MVMKISEAGIKLICKWEEFRAYAYVCPAGLWTIGYGHTGGVKPTDKIDIAQGEAYLRKDLEIVERCLNSLAIKLNQNQYDALCSLILISAQVTSCAVRCLSTCKLNNTIRQR